MSNKVFNAMFVVGVIARVAGIWIPQLWYDENFTWILAWLPFDRMMTATAGDVHPPLWYLVEWGFVHGLDALGVSVAPWMSRIPALIFSVAALALFRSVMDELRIPARIQTGAMVLMAIMPMQLWYGQEARMYSLLELEVLAALLFTLRRQWLGLFASATLLLYTQNYSVFYLACIGMIGLARDVEYTIARSEKMEDMAWTASAMFVAGVCYLPWVQVLSRQMDYIGGRYWIQDPLIGDVLNMVYRLFWAAAMPGFALLSAFLATFMALSVGLIHMAYSRHAARYAIITMAFGPLLLAWLMSLIWHPILIHRPLIGSAGFLYIIVAFPLEKLLDDLQSRSWREAVIAGVLVVPIMVAGIGGYYKNIPDMKNDGAVSSTIEALEYVKAHWQEGDVIYYTDDGPLVNVMPYAGDLPQYGMAACGERGNSLVLGALNPATRDAFGVVVADLAELEYQRAWVFAPMSPLHPQCYQAQIEPLTVGDPVVTVDNNTFISSGVWLLEKGK